MHCASLIIDILYICSYHLFYFISSLPVLFATFHWFMSITLQQFLLWTKIFILYFRSFRSRYECTWAADSGLPTGPAQPVVKETRRQLEPDSAGSTSPSPPTVTVTAWGFIFLFLSFLHWITQTFLWSQRLLKYAMHFMEVRIIIVITTNFTFSHFLCWGIECRNKVLPKLWIRNYSEMATFFSYLLHGLLPILCKPVEPVGNRTFSEISFIPPTSSAFLHLIMYASIIFWD